MTNEKDDTTERYYAEMEAARNAAEKKYFDARLLDRQGPLSTAFRAGFERAFASLWRFPAPAKAEVMPKGELSVTREDDGGRAYELYIDKRNVVTFTFQPSGKSYAVWCVNGVTGSGVFEQPEVQPSVLLTAALTARLARAETQSARFEWCQSNPHKAQAFFWNYTSRHDRAKAIDTAMQASGVNR